LNGSPPKKEPAEALGVLLAALGGIALGIGSPLLKYGLLDLIAREGHFNPFRFHHWLFMIRSPIFIVGFVCMVIGGLLGFLAYSYARSLVALPVTSGVHYAVIPFTCAIILHEAISAFEATAIAAIVTGVLSLSLLSRKR